MPDLLNVTYAQTGKSTAQNSMGMREMQARAYEKRNAQYLLLKAPPASGKSRALMFLALDKINKQGLKKAIIAVPEMSIGGSFQDTNLTQFGFFADWHIDEAYNLCTSGNNGKVEKVLEFLDNEDVHYLLCTHATLRFAFERLSDIHKLDSAVIAIDEFHHTSAEDGNKLGAMLDKIMSNTTAHLVAMTGSYFRGDHVPILNPDAEAKFTQMTYTYYEQLNGYKHLRTLGLGYHFYQGRYFTALRNVLDINKKTIVHIPNVNSRESSGYKQSEVDIILDSIGSVEKKDRETGIITLRTPKGRLLRVADLVTDDAMRVNVLKYLRENAENPDMMDIIIALGMAKEGFDWPCCEHVLTIGYRNSLTEVVQIIGRATRDCEGKSHAQFTNLIAQPDAADEDVKNSVNNLLKAITLSLLMREVLAPNITFKPRSSMKEGEKTPPGTIVVEDNDKPLSKDVKKILENGGIGGLVQDFISNPEKVGPAIVNHEYSSAATKVELCKAIQKKFSSLSPEDISTIADIAMTHILVNTNGGIVRTPENSTDSKKPEITITISSKEEKTPGEGSNEGADSLGKEFLQIGDRLLDVANINIDLIDKINPFLGAYEILSKSVDAPMLKTIQDHVTSRHSSMTEEEAVLLWDNIKEFKQQFGVSPSLASTDSYERRLAEALAFIRNRKAQRMQKAQAERTS